MVYNLVRSWQILVLEEFRERIACPTRVLDRSQEIPMKIRKNPRIASI